MLNYKNLHTTGWKYFVLCINDHSNCSPFRRGRLQKILIEWRRQDLHDHLVTECIKLSYTP
jgi:hypothetical protein